MSEDTEATKLKLAILRSNALDVVQTVEPGTEYSKVFETPAAVQPSFLLSPDLV